MSADEPGLGKKVAQGVAWAGGAQAIIAVADLISFLLVTVYWVSTDDLGIVGAVIPFYTALDYIADLGVSNALIQHDDHTPERVSTVFWFNVLISTGLFIMLLGLGPLYAWFQSTPVIAWLMIAYGAKLLIQNVYAIPFALLRKELRFADVAKARIVAHLSESVGRVIFAYLGLSYWSFTLAAITRAFVFGVIIQLRHPFLPRFVFRPREVIDYVKFGARTAASNVLYQVYTSLDAPIVFHYFGAEAAGIYTLADTFILEPVKTIANVVIDVAFPTFAKLRADRRAVAVQLIKFTRLNLLAVLPYTILILLVAPEILNLFWLGHGAGDVKWTPGNIELCTDAIRLLCVMGFFRSMGFLGPPLLDGMGRPDLTLRYMIVATFAVPGSFLLGAKLLGPSMGFLSVALAWAIGYPIAFAVLAYLVMHTIKLPVREYLRASWGIIASCGIAAGVGFGVALLLPTASDVVRLVAIGGSALITMALLFTYWQKLTPRSISRSLHDD
ncbi:MAG: oligosaccharide flippase family protein [Kofleriaceae bacterium]